MRRRNKEIKQSFWQWVFCNHYGWKRKYIFQIGNNPFLMMLTHLCLWFNWFNKDGKFKPGDKVVYNLFARACIPTIEEIKGLKKMQVYTFIDYEQWSTSKGNGRYLKENGEEDGCSVFWLSKVNR